jgi:hypothetical protein
MITYANVSEAIHESLPLIDEEFDTFPLDLPTDYVWATLACDESEWEDSGSAF